MDTNFRLFTATRTIILHVIVTVVAKKKSFTAKATLPGQRTTPTKKTKNKNKNTQQQQPVPLSHS